MGRWLRRFKGAIVLGGVWAFGWALLSIPMELWIDPNGRIADIWPMVLAIPGFLAGTMFAFVLAVSERQRRFDELSIARFAVWGAVAGGVLGALMVALLSGGFSAFLSPRGLFVEGIVAVLGTVSAAGTFAIARKGEAREIGPGEDQRGLPG